MSLLLENLSFVRRQIAEAARNAGRKKEDVKLLVVSKTIPLPYLQELYDAGIREFGENREPELARKAVAMPQDVRWHFIGPLQANKVRKVVQIASVIHSVSSLSLLSRLDRIAGEEGKSPDFLLEVNVSGEASKGGLTPSELPEAAEAAAKSLHARCRGLMTMAPLDADDAVLRQVFGGLRLLRDREEARLHFPLPLLSMGMSGDFPVAIAEGAGIVRVGSRIFQGIPRA